MLETYKAVLRGDKIEWETDAPKILEKKKSIAVYVIVIDENKVSDLPDGKKMAEALDKVASESGVSAIENASDWQRAQRVDRTFAGREEQ